MASSSLCSQCAVYEYLSTNFRQGMSSPHLCLTNRTGGLDAKNMSSLIDLHTSFLPFPFYKANKLARFCTPFTCMKKKHLAGACSFRFHQHQLRTRCRTHAIVFQLKKLARRSCCLLVRQQIMLKGQTVSVLKPVLKHIYT